MSVLTIGWTEFAKRNSTFDSGNSYTEWSNNGVVSIVKMNWDKRTPGDGETTTDRKVLVPVPPEGFFCPARAKLVEGMPIRSEVVTRQEGEEPYIETFVTPLDAEKMGAVVKVPAASVNIVCYSAEALLENGGTRSTTFDWEIVCILAEEDDSKAPMTPLTMSRNQLEKPGGTKSEYTAEEYAESIWYWSQRGVKIRDISKP